jgi:hypothetical protein
MAAIEFRVRGPGWRRVADWVFIDGTGELVIANTTGEKISAISGANRLEAFAVAPRKAKGGLLVTLSSQMVTAYELKR